jgi:hypothetical protein
MYRPLEAYLEENKPGDKAMTRKLAVTVFAMSLTLVGCGSSSTTKPDVGADVKAPVADVAGPEAAKPDLAVVPGPEVGVPTPDAPIPDAAVPADTATPDAPVADVGRDGGQLGDGGSLTDVKAEGGARPEGGIDVPIGKLDALDAPATDAPDAGDGGTLDGGTVDGGDGGRG